MPGKKAKTEQPQSEAGPTDGDQPVSAKRNRRAGRGRKALKGNGLLEMPLDAINEICSYLQPFALLMLARTTKVFRDYLMTRRAALVWKTARGNVEGLPDCPPYLAEPFYAELMFGVDCHDCGRLKEIQHMWGFNIRCCWLCRSWLFKEEGKFDQSTQQLIQSLGEGSVLKLQMGEKVLRLRKDVEKLVETFSALPPGSTEWAATLEARKRRCEDMIKHGKQCKDWYCTKLIHWRAKEESDLRNERWNDILSRLRSLGWGEELDCLKKSSYYTLRKDSRVTLAKPLTEKAWKFLEGPLVKILQDYRDSHRDYERRCTIKERLDVLAKGVEHARWTACSRNSAAFLPTLVDLAHMDPFRSLLDPDADTPTLLKPDSFDELCLQLTAHLEIWQRKVNDSLASLVALSSPSTAGNLTRACVAFDCNKCKRNSFEFPGVVAHECLYTYNEPPRTDMLDYEIFKFSKNTGRLPWSSDNLRLSSLADLNSRRTVISACGLDPDVATSEQMDDLDARLACSTCSDGASKYIMDWRTAIYHSHSNVSSPVKWTLIMSPLLGIVRSRERAFKGAWDGYKLRLSCTRCSPWSRPDLTESELERHLEKEHKVTRVSLTVPHVYPAPRPPALKMRRTYTVAVNQAAYPANSELSFSDYVSQKAKALRNAHVLVVDLEPGTHW
ncbi:hypothetical protein PsYK624_029640 [Phanerochaete sordida]|uniref:F-box domain-containing protein n=1 Tax=Phanerochaete sordida TaxID=48140 RepID=A0A9P3G270_9APHY|nr:hypothetical protein PsYK624_029640 [Phanerochaete sordida]